MCNLFLEGGLWRMSLLTVELICLLLAAWKAPAWVKEIGLLALVTGIFFQILSMYHGFGVIQQVGDISLSLFVGGLRLSFIPVFYGMLIYGVSLILRIVRKPRI